MLRGCAAAAAEKHSARRMAGCHDLGKTLRVQIVFRYSLSIDHGYAGVGLADKRKLCEPAQLQNKAGCHIVRRDAVETHGASSGFFQLPQYRPCLRPGEKGTVGLHGE